MSVWVRGLILSAAVWGGGQNVEPTVGAAAAVNHLVDQLQSDGAPGCALAVNRGRIPLLRRFFGLANLEAGTLIDNATIFEAGSASKQIASAAVLLLAIDGKLSLDDDVRKFVPEIPAYGAPITIGQLLTHTSGLRDWRALMFLQGYPLGTRVHTQQDVLELLSRQRGLNHPPGQRYEYTNSGYSLLPIIVLRASGSTLEQFSEERLFRPLGMLSTHWRTDFETVVPHRAMAYRRNGRMWLNAMPFERVYGAGGLLTTVDDLIIWNQALQDERIGAGITARMEQPTPLANGEVSLYGKGLQIDTYLGWRRVGHGGTTAGYQAWTGRIPDQNLLIAVLCNGSSYQPTRIAERLASLFLSERTTSARPPRHVDPSLGGSAAAHNGRPWMPSAEELSLISGTYRSEEVNAVISLQLIEGDKLQFVVMAGERTTRALEPTLNDQFVGVDVRIEVQRNSKKEVSGLLVSVPRAERVYFSRWNAPR